MSRLRILIADDDNEFLESMSELIEARGHSTSMAHNGLEAIKIFNEQDIDLLLIDLKMPGMNGIDTYEKIREIAANKLVESMQNQGGVKTMNVLKQTGNEVPVIIITAYSMAYKEELEKLNSIYTLDIIQKPFEAEELFKKIEAFSKAS